MSDELDRARNLRVVSLETPYYIEYGVHDSESCQSTRHAWARWPTSSEGRARLPRIQVRVGDYKFDNGNYIYSDLQLRRRLRPGPLPIDDNYTGSAAVLLAGDRCGLQVGAGDHRPQAGGAAECHRHRPDARFFQRRAGHADRRLIPKRAVDEEGLEVPRAESVRCVRRLSAHHRLQRGRSGIGQGAFYLVNSEGTRGQSSGELRALSGPGHGSGPRRHDAAGLLELPRPGRRRDPCRRGGAARAGSRASPRTSMRWCRRR